MSMSDYTTKLKFEQQIRDFPKDKIIEMLRDCHEAQKCSNHSFTDWELKFIMNNWHNYERYGPGFLISPKAQYWLEKIWDKI